MTRTRKFNDKAAIDKLSEETSTLMKEVNEYSLENYLSNF